jgi:hypothetical protein
MSDKKISELTALTAPDGAEELVINDGGTSKKITIDNLYAGSNNLNVTGSVAVSDGSTSAPSISFSADTNTGFYRAGSDQLQCQTGGSRVWKAESNQDLRVYNNIVFNTSGDGIDFSATSDGSGTMTSEVLDDYEEGTWIPTITFETPGDLSVAYHANTNATYTKVGRLVTISFYVRTTTFSHSTASGDLRILGIPFTPRTYTGMKSEGGTTYYGLNKSGFTQATVLVNSASSVITMSAVGIAGSSISTVNANDAPGVGGRVDISGVISYETDS